jgi:hypothetical protein
MPQQQRQQSLLRTVAVWWESDSNRLRVIRVNAYGLLAASVAGSIYGAIRGVLPIWAITIYVAFVVQLTFMTFMYAIRHSGAEEIHRSVYELRRRNLPAWRFEREMLAEFAGFAFCTSHGIDPGPADLARRSSHRLRQAHIPWPQVDAVAEACRYVREQLVVKMGLTPDSVYTSTSDNNVDQVLLIDLIAYSAETLINLTRGICLEIDDVQREIQGNEASFEGKIRVRVLIRDHRETLEWLLPLATDILNDSSYSHELRTRFRNVQRSALREFQESLIETTSLQQVDFQVRGYFTEPLIKGVMVDRSRGLLGFYTISDLMYPQGWDYSGHAVALCPCAIDGDYVSALSTSLFNRWFDKLWESEQLSRAIGILSIPWR